MWPWEHLAFGYLLYSLTVRSWQRRPPAHTDVLVLVLATQAPDLVDKPLAWVFHVLPSGLSLAHSLLFAVPTLVVVLAVTTRRNIAHIGVAFTTGYLSHLFGDAIYPFLLGWSGRPTFLLWPLYSQEVAVNGPIIHIIDLATGFWEFLLTPRGKLYLGFELLLLTSFLLLWLLDGRPGVPDFGREVTESTTDQ